MKPILLVADASPEIGWGHAMRTLAVAQALEGRNASVFWLTSTPQAIRELNPPCPVGGAGSVLEAAVHLVDLPDISSSWIDLLPLGDFFGTRVFMIDHPSPEGEECTITICPHFGSESWDFGAGLVCAGPGWMPLRRPFARELHAYGPKARALGYRLPDGWDKTWAQNPVHGLQPGSGEQWWDAEWSLAVVPPSTLAYECMALGIPTMLIEGVSEECDRVGKAMIEAGVAGWLHNATRGLPPDWDAVRDKAKQLVDGGGAARIARLLIQGAD